MNENAQGMQRTAEDGIHVNPHGAALTVNADDFGYTVGVNRGIAEAHARGIVTATTLMAVAPAFADAVVRARDLPNLALGLHAVLAGPFRPLTAARELCARDGCFPRSYPAAMAMLAVCPPRVLRAELAAQAQKLVDAGVRIGHIDCHKHLHCLPFVWREFVSVARAFDIRRIRRPGDTVITTIPYPATAVAADLLMRGLAELAITESPHPALRHFAGQRAVGRLDEAGLLAIITALPDGATEFMVHPGYCDNDLRCSSRLTDSRERELAALTSPRVRAALAARGIVLQH